MNPRLDPTIATGRLVLRQPRTADIADIVTGVGDPAVARMLARVPLPYGRSDAEAFLSLVRQNAEAGTGLSLSITREDRVIGMIAIEQLPVICEFGYWLARPCWGRGFATEAGAAILAYGFAILGLRLIRSSVFTGNRASLHVQQKLGFSIIGRSDRASLARGRAVPHIDTVLTRARFEALR